jgi:signal transduction histidine kinase/ActR/RegA family two-component response regulator
MSDPTEIQPTPAPLGGAADRASTLKVPESTLQTFPARRRIPVAVKLTLFVGLTLALLLAVLVTANGLFWQGVLRKTVDSHLSSVASSRRDMVRAEIALLRQRTELNTDHGELRGFFYGTAHGSLTEDNRTGSQETLQRIIREKPLISASLADATGHIILSTVAGFVGHDVSHEPEFQGGMSDTFVGLPRRVSGRYRIVVAAPVYSRSNPPRVYGVLMTTSDITDLADAVRDTTGLGESGDAILAVRDGDQLRFLFPPRNSPKVTTVPLDAAPAMKAAVGGAEVLTKNPDYRGVPVIAAGRPIGFAGWALVVKMDTKEAYKPIGRVIRLEILAGVIVTAIGLIAAYFLARSFTRPVRHLVQAAERITEGHYETLVPVKSADEFGALSRSFNEMSAAIHSQRTERDQAAEALREADRRKDEFLAMLGHELRNPLSAIANAVRLWNVAGHDPEAIELARGVIDRQTGHLSRLVDDLLDVARITAGKIELRKRPVDVSEAVRRSVQAAQPFIEGRRHELEITLAPDVTLCVDADPTRLEQIITNLLTNAIKYTRKGGTIRLETRQEGDDAVIIVSDNGIGITPRMLPQIFELFTQGDRSLDRTTGGLGIGLSLCRRLVELHGGTITAASEGVGRGATFTVRLPATTMPPISMLPQPSTASEPPHRQRRILLVDDNQDTVRSLARLLSLRGHEVATAFDGVAALKLAQEFRPDFLLLDLGLPGLDGYEVARRLRAEGFPRTPIVAISGYAQENDRIRSREAGFNHHFAKPVDFEALADLIVEDPIEAD